MRTERDIKNQIAFAEAKGEARGEAIGEAIGLTLEDIQALHA